MQNSLWLHARPNGRGVTLKIGHSGSGRAVRLTDDDEAVKLGHRLMSLGSGGETRGFEKYPQTENSNG